MAYFCKNGVTTLLTEAQVTEIKAKLRPTPKVVGALTSLDIERMTLQVIQYHQARVSELEKQVAELVPKAQTLDKITASKNDISVRDLASILAIPGLGQNNLFRRLQQEKYIDAAKHPYRQYIESGIMYEREYYLPQLEEARIQLRITQKGVAYFTRKYMKARANT
jgi:phage antirepressor YoqD-like protein